VLRSEAGEFIGGLEQRRRLNAGPGQVPRRETKINRGSGAGGALHSLSPTAFDRESSAGFQRAGEGAEKAPGAVSIQIAEAVTEAVCGVEFGTPGGGRRSKNYAEKL